MSSDASQPALKPHRRILELDALRAMAALNLVLFHFTYLYAVKFGYSSSLGFEWPYGAYGVEMFFILSGFVNSMSLLRRGKPVGIVTSGAHGHRTGKTLALAYLRDPAARDHLEVAILGRRRAARILGQAPFDPTNSRLKS